MMHMLHPNKIHKLVVPLNNKDKSRLWADYTSETDWEFWRHIWLHIETVIRKFFFFNSKGMDFQICDAKKENVVAP